MVVHLVHGSSSGLSGRLSGSQRNLIGRLHSFVLLCAACLLLLLTAVPGARGQTSTSSLSGTVTDGSGAAVAKAMVVLTNDGTQTSVEATTNGSGYFSFPVIQPGKYSLKITAAGFSAWQERGIVLYQQDSRTVPSIVLKVGAVTETVEVSAADEPVPLDNGAVTTTLNNTMVSQLAIQGRDAAELIRLMPGMAMNSGLSNSQWNSYTTKINSGPIGQFSSNGAQPNGSMQLVMDGSVITDAGNQGTQIANINQDMTQEVTIQTSAFDAEHAHGPVTFSAIGKSGTSQFHGEGYLYTRNGSLNANESVFNAKGVTKPIDHYWYEGFNVGGPVLPHTHLKDKAFFFFAYGLTAEPNCRRCPETARLLKSVPGIKTAFFSILKPHAHIPEHCGAYKGVIRYHLGMIVPKPEEACRIKVGGQTAHWREGEGIFFDDTFPHEVWNDTDGLRVVLLMDVVRPLRFPISLLNAFIIRLIAASPFIQDAARNYEQWERRVSAIWDK